MKDFFRMGIDAVMNRIALDVVDPDTQVICALLFDLFPKESEAFSDLLKMVIGWNLVDSRCNFDHDFLYAEYNMACATYRVEIHKAKEAMT